MGDLDLKGLREVLAKMSPRPWRNCSAQPDGRCACGLVWSIPADLIVATVKPVHCDGASTSNGADAVGIADIVNAAPALLSRIEELEAGLREAVSVLEECVDGERRAQRMYAGGAVPGRAEDVLDSLRSLLHPEAPRDGEGR